MSDREQELKDLRERYDILIQTVHDMNDLIHELRDENRTLKEIIKVFQDG
jgi:FtsZ-binding cell division protein ZapB|tara:strand:+ start:187 stop:336 length:150 start_codon:yes stop_codon:yes gene_type:complete